MLTAASKVKTTPTKKTTKKRGRGSILARFLEALVGGPRLEPQERVVERTVRRKTDRGYETIVEVVRYAPAQSPWEAADWTVDVFLGRAPKRRRKKQTRRRVRI